MLIIKLSPIIGSDITNIYYLSSLKQGLGTNDRTLVRVMVTRCEVDMVQIKQEFQRMVGKTLESFIEVSISVG